MVLPAAIVLPLLLRELAHWRYVGGTGVKASLWGAPCCIVWNSLFVLLLVLALVRSAGAEPTATMQAGVAVLWAGTLLKVLSYRDLGRFYSVPVTVRPDHSVVRTGTYRFLRHPMHLGIVIEMSGLALVTGHVLAWIPVAAALLVLVLRNLREEAMLLEKLGSSYAAYVEQTWDPTDLLPRRWRPHRSFTRPARHPDH